MPKVDMKKDKKNLLQLQFISFQLDRTALHWAAANGNIDVIEKLIEDGADLESKDKVNIKKDSFYLPFSNRSSSFSCTFHDKSFDESMS